MYLLKSAYIGYFVGEEKLKHTPEKLLNIYFTYFIKDFNHNFYPKLRDTKLKERYKYLESILYDNLKKFKSFDDIPDDLTTLV